MFRQPAVLLVMALLGGCAGEYSLVGEFDPPALGSQATGVQLALLDRCPELGAPASGAAYEARLRRGEPGAVVSMAELDPGSYALYGVARDDACGLVAAGCATVELESGGGDELRVRLGAIAVDVPCASGACDRGVCITQGAVDAGPMDAGPLDAGPLDAGPPDAGTDAGDAGVDDAGPVDAGPVDAGPPDTGPLDAGPPDAGPPDAGSCLSLLASDLEAHYRFGDGGNLGLDSAGGHNLTCGPSPADCPMRPAANIASFDGSQCLHEPNAPVALRPSSVTITAWLRVDSTLGSSTISAATLVSSDEANLWQIEYRGSDSELAVVATPTTSSREVGKFGVARETWVFVAVVGNSTEVRFYSAGSTGSVTDRTTRAPDGLLAGMSPHGFYLGCEDSVRLPWLGELADVRVYSDTLTTSELECVRDAFSP